ncbi:hypothetical protein CHLRE_12g542202v5 [Chlamydomonas reinhardtii]|uniref:protein-ribulosamine 3-kinase n=1 Tax=Chlamydomonas reinhardtii TaxID=3055 RepID=A0A2K3D715_CHLRE|nr:uncharacterized protein CHLRE_12g542202v5 [Chlamydomonas reinhardtii]PNW76317.1 hypothetical protein CHLRE_12g542202v5 [Chlamydomonas reinhardtii]
MLATQKLPTAHQRRGGCPAGSQRATRARCVRVMAAHPAAYAWIEEHLGSKVVKESLVSSSGWSSAYVVDTQDGKRYFVKTALGRDEAMFKGEALGLQAMYDTNTMRIPKVFHYGPLAGAGRGGSFIVMEHLDMARGRLAMRELGRRLALMHLAVPKEEHAAAGQFGFPVDNTIGGTPQANGWMSDWVVFLRDRRLMPQLKMAGDSRLMRMGEKLCSNLSSHFEGIEVKPSILHGDLWSGNIGAVGEEPTIFDPACYYGHHEAEFGMSWCAGFSPDFYAAYHELIPCAPGFEQRAEIYRLYHYLNHLNLFGDSYYSQCASILQRLT